MPKYRIGVNFMANLNDQIGKIKNLREHTANEGKRFLSCIFTQCLKPLYNIMQKLLRNGTEIAMD